MIASSAHERNWDIPKMHHALVKQQRGLILGHHTPTELHQRQLPIHHKLDASPFQLNCFFTSQGCCSGSEPSSSRLLRSKAKRCAASPPIVLRNSLAPIRSSCVKWHAVGALCSWLVELLLPVPTRALFSCLMASRAASRRCLHKCWVLLVSPNVKLSPRIRLGVPSCPFR